MLVTIGNYINTGLFNTFVLLSATYMIFLFQSSDALENCGFVRWVNPPPIDPHQEYIEYLQTHIFDLEREVSHANEDDKEDENNKGASSSDEP